MQADELPSFEPEQEQKKTFKSILAKYEWDVKAGAATQLVSGICIEGVVASIIVGLVPAESKTKRIKRMIAAHCIAGLVAKETSEWAGKSVYEVAKTIKETVQKVQADVAEKEAEADE